MKSYRRCVGVLAVVMLCAMGCISCSKVGRSTVDNRPGATNATSKVRQAKVASGPRATDSSKTVSVVIPEGWKEQKAGFMGAKMILIGPTVNGFTSNIGVVTERTANMGLDDYEKLSIKNMGKMFPGFQVHKTADVDLAGVAAKDMIYTGKLLPGRSDIVKVRTVYAIKDSTAYIFTYSAMSSEFDKNAKAMDTVVDTVKWLK